MHHDDVFINRPEVKMNLKTHFREQKYFHMTPVECLAQTYYIYVNIGMFKLNE